MRKPLTLSVIIPAYNEEDHLEACLQALQSQSVLPDEVIIVDNNSTDKTKEVARKFAFVRVVNEKKQGLAYARNCGFNTATSDILCRIDADTYVDSVWVESIKKAFSDPQVQALTGSVGYHDMPFKWFTRFSQEKALSIARFGNYRFLIGPNMAITKNSWQLVKDEVCDQSEIFEDVDLSIHLQSHGIKLLYFPDARVTTSSRRLDSTLTQFMKYIGGHSRTIHFHEKSVPLGAYFTEASLAILYLGAKPIHMLYDPATHRPSLSRLRHGRDVRPDPMATKRDS